MSLRVKSGVCIQVFCVVQSHVKSDVHFAAILLLVQEVDQPRRSVIAMCHSLFGQYGLRKPYKPSRDIKCFLMFIQLIATCLPLTLDRKGQHDEAGLSDIFRE